VKILLIKLNHIGDTLLLTPTINFLARKFPGAQLDVMVRAGCDAVLRGHPSISRLIPIANPDKNARTIAGTLRENWQALKWLAGQRHDYAFALTVSDRAILWSLVSGARCRVTNDVCGEWGGKRRYFHRLSQFDWSREHQVLRDFRTVADLIEPDATPGPLTFHPQISERELLEKFPELSRCNRLAVIHATSRWAFKQWLPERWAAVADALHREHGYSVAFTAGPAPAELAHLQAILGQARESHLNLAGKTSLHELGRLLGRAQLFLGVDTVAMHLAAAMQAPTVALFGPSSEWSWHPWQCRHELVLGECSCKATRQFVCDKSKPYPCMQKITVAEVLAAADKLAAASRREK
jgi:heptosyltransferase-3